MRRTRSPFYPISSTRRDLCFPGRESEFLFSTSSSLSYDDSALSGFPFSNFRRASQQRGLQNATIVRLTVSGSFPFIETSFRSLNLLSPQVCLLHATFWCCAEWPVVCSIGNGRSGSSQKFLLQISSTARRISRLYSQIQITTFPLMIIGSSARQTVCNQASSISQ
jgi:hypothetical protein